MVETTVAVVSALTALASLWFTALQWRKVKEKIAMLSDAGAASEVLPAWYTARMMQDQRAVGWAKRSVPTRFFESGLRELMEAFPLPSHSQSVTRHDIHVGTLRFAHPTKPGKNTSERSLDEAQRNPG